MTDQWDRDIEGICANAVEVSSWVHSGPVSVKLYGVIIPWLVDKMLEDEETKECILRKLGESNDI